MDSQRQAEWARALCAELGLGSYMVGSFASAMAKAVLVADSSNRDAIAKAFPDLTYALHYWQTFGGEYLAAMARGDEDAMDAIYESHQEWLVAEHDRQLDSVEV